MQPYQAVRMLNGCAEVTERGTGRKPGALRTFSFGTLGGLQMFVTPDGVNGYAYVFDIWQLSARCVQRSLL